MGKATTKEQKRTVGIVAAVATLLIVAGFLYWLLFWTGSTKPIEAVAGQFKPDTAWTLKSEHTEPPRALCIDVACPHVAKEWSAHEAFTKSQITTILDNANWQYRTGELCSDADASTWLSCTLYAQKDGFDITLSISNSEDYGNSLRLSIEKA